MSKKIGIIAVLMLSQFPFVAMSKETNTDAAVQRLVKIAKQRKAQGVTSEPTVTKDSTSAANVKVKKPRRVRVNRKNMSESEKMDYEITRISKRVDEINKLVVPTGSFLLLFLDLLLLRAQFLHSLARLMHGIHSIRTDMQPNDCRTFLLLQ